MKKGLNSRLKKLNMYDVGLLKNYLGGTGNILSRKITKLSCKHQRFITKLIKVARNFLLL